MDARQAVLLTSLDSALLACLLLYKQNAPITPLGATLTNSFASVADKGLITSLDATLTAVSPATPLEATLTKNTGGKGGPAGRTTLPVRCRSLSPLFATLTKTPGVWGYSSQFGTLFSPLLTRLQLEKDAEGSAIRRR